MSFSSGTNSWCQETLQPPPIILWPLNRAGASRIAGDLILLVCAVALTLILYVLLRPVNKNLVLLAVFFNLVECAIDGVNKLCLFAALFLSGNADYLKAFEPHQLHALVKISLKLHDYGFAIDLVFFGFACLVYGYLLFRSGYFPRTLGVLMAIAGLSYLANSLPLILAPTYGERRSSSFWCLP